jgi:tetratricopeptide (TPR) repeat protein
LGQLDNLKRLLIIILFSFFAANAFPQKTVFDSTVIHGIKEIYNLQFPDAQNTFKNLISKYPDKPQGKFFIAMIDWWKILVDPDNESYDDIFYQKIENVINQCDDILDKDPDNEDALFFKGGAIGFRGRLRAFRESWLKAADDGRIALPIVEKAWKLDPKNVDVQLGFGIYNYFASVIPDDYPAIKPLMIFFPPGNKEKGIKQLENVAWNGMYAKYEARYFLMTLYFNYEKDPIKADRWAKMLTSDFPDNPVFERWSGRIAVKRGDYFAADSIFRDVIKKADKNYYGYNNPNAMREADYYIAFKAKMVGDLSTAKNYFNQCVKYSQKIDKKEASGFIINSYLYLGMIDDAQGNRNEAISYYKKLLDLREYGNSHSLAEKYLKQPYKQ